MVTFTAASACSSLSYLRRSPQCSGLQRCWIAIAPKAIALSLSISGAWMGWGSIAPSMAQAFEDAPQSSLLGIGNQGEAVVRLQRRLAELGFFQGEATGVYGPLTEEAVIRYQNSVGLLADGVSGPETLGRLFAQPRPTAQVQAPTLSSSQLSSLQSQLSHLGFYLGTVDGINGPQTEAAINSFQSVYSLPVTGTADQRTLSTIDRIYAQTPGADPAITTVNAPVAAVGSSITSGNIRRDVSNRSVTLPPAIPSGPTVATTIPQTTITSVPLPPPVRSQEFGTGYPQAPTYSFPSQSTAPANIPTNVPGVFSTNPQPAVEAAAEVTGYPYVVAVPIKTGATLDEVRQVLASAFLAGSKRGLYIQAGAYNSREDAEQVTQALRDRRLDARVVYRPK